MATVWKVLNPVGRPAAAAAQAHPREHGVTSGAITLGFLSNKKPNTGLLEQELGKRLSAKVPAIKVAFYEKLNSASPAAGELIDRIAKESTYVINGVGD